MLVLAVAIYVAPRPAHPAQFKASIEGLVREVRTGQPISGANVFLFEATRFGPSPTSVPSVTDAEGRFTLNITAPGVYRLFPEKSGLVYARPGRLKQPQTGIVVRVSESGQTSNVDLPMVPEGSLTGKIVDITTGQPIPSASLGLSYPVFDNLGNIGSRPVGITQAGGTVQTNDRGEFRLYGLQPGDYYLLVFGGGFGNLPRYHPGVNEVAKATVIHVEEGLETRISPMMMESPSRAVQVRLRFTDPSVTTLRLSIEMLGTGTSLSSSEPRIPIPPPREMTLALSRGPYDLLISASSKENDLLYARETFEVGVQEMVREIRMMPGIRVDGSMKLEDASGKRLDITGVRCRLQSPLPVSTAQSAPYGCLRGQVSAGHYWLEISGLPPDAYVVTAKSGERDILREGLSIERETQFDIALATPGAVIDGTVTNDKGERLSDAMVALVPDAPYRDASPLYRADVSTYDGTFELRGIAPGAYRLFAWSDLQGAAYRNAEFMKKYEERGKPLKIENGAPISVDLTALE